jgi:hypothetical protein
VDSCHYRATSLVTAFESVSDSITSYVHDSNSTWPFVTVSDFEVRSIQAREASFTELVGFVPLIATANRMTQWEAYAQENLDLWLVESRLTTAKTNYEEPRDGTAITNGHGSNVTARMLLEEDQNQTTNGPFAPIWQISPPPVSERVAASDGGLVGYDLLTHPTMERLLFAMWESERIVLSPITDVAFLIDWEPTRQVVNLTLDVDTRLPRSVIFQPIYTQHNFHNDNPGLDTPKLQGIYFGVLSWQSYFEGLVPEGVNGIYCVIRNDCEQSFTFLINGREAVYLGEGDLHETRYDANEISTTFPGLDQQDPSTMPNTNVTSINEDHFQCRYSLSIYPSAVLQEEQQSSAPFFFTTIVGMIFVLTFVVVLIYMKITEYRTKKVEKVAKASDKIITALFPEDVKQELMKDATREQKAKDDKTKLMSVTATHNKSGHSALVGDFLSGGDEESAFAGASMEMDGPGGRKQQSQYKTKPIANLFEETTIFFADIQVSPGKACFRALCTLPPLTLWYSPSTDRDLHASSLKDAVQCIMVGGR